MVIKRRGDNLYNNNWFAIIHENVDMKSKFRIIRMSQERNFSAETTTNKEKKKKKKVAGHQERNCSNQEKASL
jgi:hypothetical protein